MNSSLAAEQSHAVIEKVHYVSQLSFWISTRVLLSSMAFPVPFVIHSSPSVPTAFGRHTGPGFTKMVPSTIAPDGFPDTDGKTQTSGEASSTNGKSRAAA